MKFTAQSIEGLRLGTDEKDKIWFDYVVPGFGLRARNAGSPAWIFQYKIGSLYAPAGYWTGIRYQARPRAGNGRRASCQR